MKWKFNFKPMKIVLIILCGINVLLGILGNNIPAITGWFVGGIWIYLSILSDNLIKVQNKLIDGLFRTIRSYQIYLEKKQKRKKCKKKSK